MAFPIKVCAACGVEFELKPDKPGFANRCASCSEDDAATSPKNLPGAAQANPELNAARKQAIRDLLYRKDS